MKNKEFEDKVMNAYNKCVAVINSCKTRDQWYSASNMINNFFAVFMDYAEEYEDFVDKLLGVICYEEGCVWVLYKLLMCEKIKKGKELKIITEENSYES